MGVIIENRSTNEVKLVLLAAGTGGGDDFQGFIVDTAQYSGGLTFVPYCTQLSVAETVTFRIFESSVSNMIPQTEIPESRLTNPISELDVLAAGSQVDGDFLKAVGIVDNLRFVRIELTNTVGQLGSLYSVQTIGSIDLKPAENP